MHEAGFHSVARARTVRVRDGQFESESGGATSGPVLAGYYVVNVDGIEAAEQWAARIPTARYGAVEVRPVVEYDG
ncbi:YciI family protein [Kribbella flavida]|uniref:YciI family protein n=1 Tax=Kribbella flavida TaxID=182640 RepID=UPI00192ABC8F|nr:YciI family protein [Kribbella flavida]